MVVAIWLEGLDTEDDDAECILALGDNTSAIGWLFQSGRVNLRGAKGHKAPPNTHPEQQQLPHVTTPEKRKHHGWPTFCPTTHRPRSSPTSWQQTLGRSTNPPFTHLPPSTDFPFFQNLTSSQRGFVLGHPSTTNRKNHL
jgi:hypothetical protein